MVLCSSEGRELHGEFRLDDRWYDGVNVTALSSETGRVVLEAVKAKLGFNEAAKVLGIAKSNLHKYLSGQRRFPTALWRGLYATFPGRSSSSWSQLMIGCEP